ncbi:hypothetical protein ACIGEL_17725 [Rossellomorea aquimaris]|uniref:hypothetical protein n=1 Tax=Rossellomorea aquimaris TaxID=189382 RepID=UPI0037CBF479
MQNLYTLFKENNFKLTNETLKATEFENIESKEVVYLLPNNELTLVVNPKVVEGNEELGEKAEKIYHSTALRNFPKRKHNGKTPINYGYSFKFQSEEELSSFLVRLLIMY